MGLAASHPELNYLVQVQPVLPWFLRNRLHDQPAVQAATVQAHYRHYAQLARQFNRMLMSRDNPQQRAAGQAGSRAEYANLTTALSHGLRTGQPIGSLVLALDEYLDQAQQHDTRRQLLDTAIAVYPEPASQAQQHELATLRNLAGSTALSQHRLDDAQAHYEADLQLEQAIGNRKALAETYYQLGTVALEQRRFADAEASYRQALDIFLEFGDRHRAAGTYHQLGTAAQEQQRFADAEASYRKALDIFLEFGDRHSAAGTYHQLGTAAQEQQRFADAEASYRQALDIRQESDPPSASGTASMLGITLAQLGQHHEAVRTLLYAAVTRRQQTGQWNSHDLAWLHRERALISPGDLAALISTDVAPELADDLTAAIEQATDSADAETDEGDSTSA